MTNTYQANNGNLIKSTYGNGAYTEYTYNSYGQVNLVKKDGTNKYYWRYNSSGMPYLYRDYENNRVYTYEYDSLGRIVRQFGNTRTTGENRFSSQYTYDVSNNVTKVVNIADGNKVSTSHTYDGENRPTKTTLNSNANYQYTYDNLGRLNYYYLNFNDTTSLLVNPVYYASERNTDGTDTYQTTQIKRETIGDRGYAYTYDKVGNIKTITEKKDASSSYTAKVSYTYDALGQLTRENNVDLDKTIVYTYDSGGNITSKKKYAYTTGSLGAVEETINYTYDSTWKDKLVSYGDDSITYDEIGNPLTYRDGMTFTWNGRQMKAATINGTAVTYKYDADGLRASKQVGSTLHEYEYVGGQLVYEKCGDLKFYYRYNAMGELASIKRVSATGSSYTVYVVTNTRGDVEELRITDGTLYARYVYDTWGNNIAVYDGNGEVVTSDKTNYLSIQNPFRYRGYYYDSESGLYYLQSRYYDPETGRFLNADDVDFIGASGTVLGYNAFAYCENNAVNNSDHFGYYATVATYKYKRLVSLMTTLAMLIFVLETASLSLGINSSNVYLLVVSGVLSLSGISILLFKYAQDKAYYDNLIYIASASTAATPPPPNKGGKGTQTSSKTLYNNKKEGYRIDVENPGNRQGQIHLQKNGEKYVYNVKDGLFHVKTSNGAVAPRSVQNLLGEKKVVNAIAKGLKILGY